MTGLLKDLMHDRADAIEQPVLDLDAITRAGDRRVSRRRAGVAALTVAATVAVGALVPQLLDDGPRSKESDVAVTEGVPPTWATGSVIHSGTGIVDVGHPVHDLVQTTAGFVFTTEDRAVWSWTDGAATRVGAVAEVDYGQVLVADGSRAGWVADGEQRAVFLDQATGDRREVTVTGSPEPQLDASPRVWAIDGETAYVGDGRGLVRVDLGSGEATVLRAPERDFGLADAQDGVLLFTFDHAPDDASGGSTVASTDPLATVPVLAVDGGDLSPDGRYVMSENSSRSSDDFTLVELGTGRDLTPAVKADYGFFSGYAWTGPESYVAIGIRETRTAKPTVELLTCDVGGDCTVAQADLPWGEFQLPVGEFLSP